MDYLDKQRYIPKYTPPSEKEIEEFVEKKLCKTCKNYDFYYCQQLNEDTAPERECIIPECYIPTEFYKDAIKHCDSEESAV
jgi:hypothetical protein